MSIRAALKLADQIGLKYRRNAGINRDGSSERLFPLFPHAKNRENRTDNGEFSRMERAGIENCATFDGRRPWVYFRFVLSHIFYFRK